ncbi:hypothetical protein VTO73DRAFT_12667 [Trametes versicolor]
MDAFFVIAIPVPAEDASASPEADIFADHDSIAFDAPEPFYYAPKEHLSYNPPYHPTAPLTRLVGIGGSESRF